MRTSSKNKAVGMADGAVRNKAVPAAEEGNEQLLSWYFPEFNATIRATSQEEALQKLKKHINE